MWFLSKKDPSGFNPNSTAEEVTQGIDGSALTAIVTGASSGIGAETARVLALQGVHVIMGVRNISAGRQVKETIIKDVPQAKIDALELDLSSLASVRNFASNYNSLGLPLNLLILTDEHRSNQIIAILWQSNNAGIMATPFALSKDKIELQFATNHVGHFLLTNLLLDTMKKTARESRKEGRIVNVSSRRHKFSYNEGIQFDKINDQSGYNGLSAYGQSKLANVLHANELARHLKDEGVEVTANSLHPGAIATNLFRQHSIISGIVNVIGKHVMKNVEQGAATTCYVALHPDVKGVSGKYYADCNIAEASHQANDPGLAKRLWDFTMSLVH
ncbi:hypothetical protein RDI58_007953 [Solanum bulbocastanum]|uniref:Short-chain dehydrogenase TIC 32, chloroplastic-like n=1 Tax=Solanum bulbocastanum TaxID=147425 RepID=A0AAN8YJ42_SOLBU